MPILMRPFQVESMVELSIFRDDYSFFSDFGGFQGSETPIKHAQILKLMAELNCTPRDDPTSVNN